MRTGLATQSLPSLRFIGGVPQVLLDFAKELNAKLGPMEEQRIKYGPDLYLITALGIKINVFVAVWAEWLASRGAITGNEEIEADCLNKDRKILVVLCSAIEFYVEHMTRCIEFLGELFVKSPFFLDAVSYQLVIFSASCHCILTVFK